ncbi:MAG: FG-GAP repeat protein, partial [Limisphaerales bacterium]
GIVGLFNSAQFGYAVDIGESGIIVGAPFDSPVFTNAGAAYIFSSSQSNGPVIVSATASPNQLFPPNHKLVPVTITVNATGSFVSCVILGVRSNQPINGKGDGNTSPDWIITGDLTLLLRAERAGNIKTDRVYTITILCADSFGNTARREVAVTVPHDNGK